MAKVFISYRRADSAPYAGRIYDRLILRFGQQEVFKDVDNIPAGVNFATYIQGALRECAVALVVIGPRWLDDRKPSGERWLDDPRDATRIEIETALALGVTVIPVLLDGATMPAADMLPESLRPLALINGLALRNDPNFTGDAEGVIATVERILAARPAPGAFGQSGVPAGPPAAGPFPAIQPVPASPYAPPYAPPYGQPYGQPYAPPYGQPYAPPYGQPYAPVAARPGPIPPAQSSSSGLDTAWRPLLGLAAAVLVVATIGVLLSQGVFRPGGQGNGGVPTASARTTISTPTVVNVDKHIILGTSFAVSGANASAQLPAEYAVNLAVSQNQDLGNGYTLSVVNKDYEGASGSDPNIGQADVQGFVNDPEVMAFVGPFNSSVAKFEIPVINNAGGPVAISPTNTNPGLTLQQYAQEAGVNYASLHPAGKDNYYFRVSINDYVQGKADAQIALTAPSIEAHTAFVVDDNTTYGKPLADFFTMFFTSGGGTIVGTRTSITSDTQSTLPQVAANIKAANPDVVFFGGLTSQGGCKLKAALAAKGYTKSMIVGDGVTEDPECITDAGTAAAGIVGTIAAPDPSALTSSAVQTFKSQYEQFTAGRPNNDFTPYAVVAYDAAMVEITAIKNVIKNNQVVTRKAVRDAVAAIQYPGLVGSVSFDANGDNAGQKIVSTYTVVAGSPPSWTYQSQIIL